MTAEHRIQNEIRLALADSCVMFRVNVGSGVTYDGRHFSTGVPKGFSDLFGVRVSDGRAVFIEVKAPDGKPSEDQLNFIEQMKSSGAIAGVCYSVEDALKLVREDDDNA